MINSDFAWMRAYIEFLAEPLVVCLNIKRRLLDWIDTF